MQRRGTRGFTMIEMMFAIMICSVVLLALLSVLSSMLRYQKDGRAYEKVSVAANSILGQAGEALADDFERPLVPDVFPAGRQALASVEGVTFEVGEVAERVDLRRVDVTLYWLDGRGVEHSKTMTTKFLKEK